MTASKIPKKLQAILWSASVEDLDLKVHKSYLIHQILMFGELEDICWLFGVYPKPEINDTFLNSPQKVYTRESFNYVKNFVLDLKNKNISPDKYVNTIYSAA